MNKLPILIVGASGNLGSMLTMEALKSSAFKVSIFIRDTDTCMEMCSMVEKEGGKVFKGDVTNEKDVKGVTKGIHTVISTLNGDDSVMITGQKLLLEDCLNNGVMRFVPSDFTMNIWNLSEGTQYFIDQKLKFRKILEKSKMKALHFSMGMMMETFFYFVQKYGFTYWGDMNQKLDLTCMCDMTKYVLEAIKDKEKTGDVMVVGSEMSIKEIVDMYNMVLNKSEPLKKMGSINDLKMKIMELKEKGNMIEALQRGYEVVFFDGSGKIKYKMNDMFPDVKVTTMEMFIKEMNSKPMMYQYTMGDIVKGLKTDMMSV